MKKLLLYMCLACSPFLFGSCGSSSDEASETDVPTKPTLSITVSDDVIGAKQVVEFSAVYKSDNPNILLTWYVNGEKQNSIPKSELTFDWRAEDVGEYVIEVAITDRDQVLREQKMVNVVETEFADAIIGDSKSKIARTFGILSDDDVITYNQTSGHKFCYYFMQDKLYKILYEYAVSMTPRNKNDYLVPVYKFRTAFERLQTQYGTPIRDNYTQLETSESKLVEYGGHIFAGGMYIEAVFQNSTRIASIYVGPAKRGMGFTFTETLEKR